MREWRNIVKISEKEMAAAKSLIERIEKSASPFHFVADAKRELDKAGCRELDLSGQWSMDRGKSYYVDVYGTTLVAFRINRSCNFGDDIRIAAAHTDWPCFRVKPNGDIKNGMYVQLNTEVYGGPIINTWLDRPLSIAGRVSVKGKSVFEPESILVDFKRPLLTIPNLAIHLNREKKELSLQRETLPIFATLEKQNESDKALIDEEINKLSVLELLSKELNVKMEDIFDYELYIYNCEKGCLFGADNEFISAPRIDNICSCEAVLKGFLEGNRKSGIDVAVFFDNEEIGSRTKQGAGSNVLSMILEKIILGLGRGREEYINEILKSTLLSVDVAHAFHPNFTQKYDITNQISLNEGIAIKTESNQRYATDSVAIAIIEGICKKNQIPYKKFANHSDVKGGGTLGTIVDSYLPMKTVDIGIPILAMHSARECMGTTAQYQLNELLKDYFI